MSSSTLWCCGCVDEIMNDSVYKINKDSRIPETKGIGIIFIFKKYKRSIIKFISFLKSKSLVVIYLYIHV